MDNLMKTIWVDVLDDEGQPTGKQTRTKVEVLESEKISVVEQREKASVSRDYLLIKANEFGWFTEAECVAWIGGTLPQDVSALIDTFPENERFKLRLSALRQETVPRETPLILAIMNLRGVTEEQMDSVYGIN